jgi:HPt (histidine-containing phosphotransfer) domain-containing protein
MDGIETLHCLLDEKLVPEGTVMIALTANAVVGAREAYLAEGFTDYLSKPIEIRHLVEKLKAYLPKRAYRENDDTDNHPGKTDLSRVSMNIMEAKDDSILKFEMENKDCIVEFEPQSGDILEFEAMDESTQEDGEYAVQKRAYDLDRLKDVGIDVTSGLDYCANDEALYFEMIDDFITSCDGKLREINRLFLDKNWRDYEVSVHALKSNARMIGAMSIYEQAKKLEDAAEGGDIEYIKKHHEDLIHDARNLIELIPHSSPNGK